MLYNLREDEAIPVDPLGVLGVELHELVEQDVGDRRHAHGGTGMAGVGLEGGIDLENGVRIGMTRLELDSSSRIDGIGSLQGGHRRGAGFGGHVPPDTGWC
jgi:hypothetical protein